jgi:hypothetical protein
MALGRRGPLPGGASTDEIQTTFPAWKLIEEIPLLVYVDTSFVHTGALEELRDAIKELVDFLDANVPRLIAYNVYFSDDASQMTVVHLHPDSASLEHHLEVGGPAFQRFKELLTLSSIRVYGEPSEKAVRLLHDKAQSLGCTDISVHRQHAGFSRLPAPWGTSA